jgi:hypothetical protein
VEFGAPLIADQGVILIEVLAAFLAALIGLSSEALRSKSWKSRGSRPAGWPRECGGQGLSNCGE